MKVTAAVLAVGLGAGLGTTTVWSQATADKGDKAPGSERQDQKYGSMDTRPFETLYLSNAGQVNDGNEALTALRLILDPGVKLYFLPSQNAIAIRGNADQIAQAKTLLQELDRPKKIYRLTFTIVDMDAGKRVGVQHFSMTAAAGQRTSLKQGSKVPIATGSYDQGKNGMETQFTYLDVGLNFDATVDQLANGVNLKSIVEQSSIAEEKVIVGVQEPIVRQTKLEGTSQLALNKTLVLGSLDVPGSTRHQEVEVVVELLK